MTRARVAILGGTGYGGMELLRYLLSHPGAEVTALTSRTEEGRVGDLHAHLRGFTGLSFTKETPEVTARLAAENEVLLFAKPHGVAAKEAPALLDAHPALRVVNLSGDFRLATAPDYVEPYGFTHPRPDLLKEAVYGLAECGAREKIRRARLVGNPGCHASATILALWPLAREGRITGRVGVASVTGSSGSGAEPKKGTHHPERFSGFRAYKPLVHQHLPEIHRALGGGIAVDFVPHSGPFSRGIHVTAFVPVGKSSEADVRGAFERAYARKPFVRIQRDPPDVRAVAGTNLADLSLSFSDGLALVTVAIDNLGKGMAGTAVQNMNLMLSLPETTGLDRPGAGL